MDRSQARSLSKRARARPSRAWRAGSSCCRTRGSGSQPGRAGSDQTSKLRPRFRSLDQFCEHVDLRACNKKVIEALIKSGSFDSFGWTRRSPCTRSSPR